MTPKLKKVLIILYIVGLSLGTLFVASVLKTHNVQVITKDPDKTTEEVKPVKVTLQIAQGTTTNSYNYSMRNIDSVSDLLRTARDDKKVYYEQTQYTNRITIDVVNTSKSTGSIQWRIFKGEVDVTDQMNDVKLRDNDVFVLKTIPLK